jgi:O-antigen/teichoic acid export membrane protein
MIHRLSINTVQRTAIVTPSLTLNAMNLENVSAKVLTLAQAATCAKMIILWPTTDALVKKIAVKITVVDMVIVFLQLFPSQKQLQDVNVKMILKVPISVINAQTKI